MKSKSLLVIDLVLLPSATRSWGKPCWKCKNPVKEDLFLTKLIFRRAKVPYHLDCGAIPLFGKTADQIRKEHEILRADKKNKAGIYSEKMKKTIEKSKKDREKLRALILEPLPSVSTGKPGPYIPIGGGFGFKLSGANVLPTQEIKSSESNRIELPA